MNSGAMVSCDDVSPPPTTAVDAFLSSSPRKNPSIVRKRTVLSRRSIKQAARRNLSPFENVTSDGGRFAKVPSSSTTLTTDASYSSRSDGGVKKLPIISPVHVLQSTKGRSSSDKIPNNCDQPKRRRLPSNSQSVNIAFPQSSGSSPFPFIAQQSKVPVESTIGCAHANKEQFVLPCTIHGAFAKKISHLVATQIISIDDRNVVRWPLSGSTFSVKQREDSSEDTTIPKHQSQRLMSDSEHRKLLDLMRSYQARENIGDVSTMVMAVTKTNSKQRNCGKNHTNEVSLDNIFSMLSVMRAGLSLTCQISCQGGSGGLEREFILVPSSTTHGTLFPIYDNVFRNNDNDTNVACNSAKMLVLKNRVNISEADADTKVREPQELLRGTFAAKEEEPGKSPPWIKEGIPNANGATAEFEMLEWTEMLKCYHQSCQAQDSHVCTPLSFVKNKLTAAIMTLWRNETSETLDNHFPVETQKMSCLAKIFELLRLPVSIGEEEGYPLIRSKVELSDAIRNRSRGAKETSSSQGFVHTLLFQVVIRLQLFIMYDDSDNTKEYFLKEYASCISKGTKVSDMNQSMSSPASNIPLTSRSLSDSKKRKRKKKMKSFTTDDFVTEICSIIELIPFVLPPSDSFTTMVNEKIVLAFLSRAPSLMQSVADFFDIDMPEGNDYYGSDSAISQSRPSDVEPRPEEQAITSQSSEKTSRWRLISSKNETHYSAPKAAQEQTPETKDQCPSEEFILFQNKVDLSERTNRRNPLLADKGRYVGRQFSNNFFREVKAVKTKMTPVNKKRKIMNLSGRNQLNEMKSVDLMLSPPKPPPKMIGLLSSSEDSHGIMKRPSLLCRSSLQKGTAPSKAHPHAHVFAAVAAMRRVSSDKGTAPPKAHHPAP